jgi:hypothetical protein
MLILTSSAMTPASYGVGVSAAYGRIVSEPAVLDDRLTTST